MSTLYLVRLTHFNPGGVQLVKPSNVQADFRVAVDQRSTIVLFTMCINEAYVHACAEYAAGYGYKVKGLHIEGIGGLRLVEKAIEMIQSDSLHQPVEAKAFVDENLDRECASQLDTEFTPEVGEPVHTMHEGFLCLAGMSLKFNVIKDH